jgi:hypothetical protein
MAKAIITIGAFKISYEQQKENKIPGQKEMELAKTINTIESHHNIICQIEGDFIQEFSDFIEEIFRKKFKSKGKVEIIDYDYVMSAIDCEKHHEANGKPIKEVILEGSLSPDLTKKLNEEGYAVIDDGKYTKISWE